MSFSAAAAAGEPRSFSLGPVKMELMTFAVASGDTSGTVTAKVLSRIDYILVGGGLALTAQPTLSGNTATLAFTDPAATVAGQILAIGR